MKIQVDWLKEYVDIDVSSEELGHLLTMAGLEIEAHEIVELSNSLRTEVLELNVTLKSRCDSSDKTTDLRKRLASLAAVLN